MLLSSLPLPHLWNFSLPLSAPDKNSRFRVCFHFQSLSSNCLRFNKKFNRFHTQLSMKQLIVFSLKKSRQVYVLFVSYFIWLVLSTGHGTEWKTIFPYSMLAIFFHSILKIFHSIQKFSSIFHSILPYHRKFRLEAMQHIFCCFASL